MSGDAGRVIYAGLHLLDRQLVGSDDRLAGKVDDLILEPPESGGPPVVTGIVTGPGAVSFQMRGWLGKWMGLLRRHLASDTLGNQVIPFGAVAKVEQHVTLARPATETPDHQLEALAVEIIGRIRGSDREAK